MFDVPTPGIRSVRCSLDPRELLQLQCLLGLGGDSAACVGRDGGQLSGVNVTEVELDEQRAVDDLRDGQAVVGTLDLRQAAEAATDGVQLLGGATEPGKVTDLDESFGVNVLLL